jgi:hypothetical protein
MTVPQNGICVARVPQAAYSQTCASQCQKTQVSEDRDLWHPTSKFKLTHRPLLPNPTTRR